MIFKKILQFDNAQDCEDCMSNLLKGFNACRLDDLTCEIFCTDNQAFVQAGETRTLAEMNGFVNSKPVKTGKKINSHKNSKSRNYFSKTNANSSVSFESD